MREVNWGVERGREDSWYSQPTLQHELVIGGQLNNIINKLTTLYTAPRMQTPAWLDSDTFSSSGVDIILHNVCRAMLVMMSGSTVRVFRQKFTPEDAVGSHTCSLEMLA
jgi:hypothetical protein